MKEYPTDKLVEFRKEIDEGDKAIVQVFQRRMELVLKVLEYKRDNKLPILNAQREEEVIRKVQGYLEDSRFDKEVDQLFRDIMKISRKLQSKVLFPFNIVLIGFMGTGKSTVGGELVKRLEMPCRDTDALIVQRAGMEISEIFARHGEAYFRELERTVVEEVSLEENTIIFCGGGVVLNKENVDNLRKKGRLTLLKAEPETILKRVTGDETRPVLKGNLSLEGIQEIMNKRNEAYIEAADIIIETDDKTVEEISMEIINKLYTLESKGV